MDMRDFIDSLSIESGATLVIIVSLLFSIPASFIKNQKLKWTAVLIIPFIAAYVLYWSPVWFFNSMSGEYSSWAPLFILPWYVAGVIASANVCFLMGKLRK